MSKSALYYHNALSDCKELSDGTLLFLRIRIDFEWNCYTYKVRYTSKNGSSYTRRKCFIMCDVPSRTDALHVDLNLCFLWGIIYEQNLNFDAIV